MPSSAVHSLADFHTFGCRAHAAQLHRIDSLKTLHEVLSRTQKDGLPYLPLGGGSNVLIRGDYEGIVLKMEIKDITIVKEDNTHLWLHVGAGLAWQVLVDTCLSRGYYGLENLTHIPGCVGAAPIQNIGAYGVELSSFFQELEAVSTKTLTVKNFEAKACHFSYRYSRLREASHKEWVITSVTLRLHKVFSPVITYKALQEAIDTQGITSPTAAQMARIVATIRTAKLPDPRNLGNAGSFFKNPIIPKTQYLHLQKKLPTLMGTFLGNNMVKIAGSVLIEAAGWKGKRQGRVGVYEKHALILVNYGGGSGEDIWQLAQSIQRDVQEKFGVALEPEVVVR